jgi:(S)-ureidoglycine aminohydrolase
MATARRGRNLATRVIVSLIVAHTAALAVQATATATVQAAAAPEACSAPPPAPASASPYAGAARPARDRRPPGDTRAASGAGYALLAPENRVYGAPPPGWRGDVSAAAVVTPALGAHFAMYLVEAGAGATLARPTRFEGALPGLERIFFVLTGGVSVAGSVEVEGMDGDSAVLGAGGYLYVAPQELRVESIGATASGATLIQIDRVYARPRGADVVPGSRLGLTDDVPVEVPGGEVFRLRRLLNATDPARDFNIHIMDFSPGEFLATKERHYNQHGLLMLEGEGLYMLDAAFLPVQAGDVIWMAPFCPQWYAALGKGRTRYFLYKDSGVDPLVHVASPSSAR